MFKKLAVASRVSCLWSLVPLRFPLLSSLLLLLSRISSPVSLLSSLSSRIPSLFSLFYRLPSLVSLLSSLLSSLSSPFSLRHSLLSLVSCRFSLLAHLLVLLSSLVSFSLLSPLFSPLPSVCSLLSSLVSNFSRISSLVSRIPSLYSFFLHSLFSLLSSHLSLLSPICSLLPYLFSLISSTVYLLSLLSSQATATRRRRKHAAKAASFVLRAPPLATAQSTASWRASYILARLSCLFSAPPSAPSGLPLIVPPPLVCLVVGLPPDPLVLHRHHGTGVSSSSYTISYLFSCSRRAIRVRMMWRREPVVEDAAVGPAEVVVGKLAAAAPPAVP